MDSRRSGLADLKSDSLDEVLDTYSDQPKLVGFREVLQSKDPRYMLQEAFIRGIRKLGDRGYPYDILIFPNHLEASLELVKKMPRSALCDRSSGKAIH